MIGSWTWSRWVLNQRSGRVQDMVRFIGRDGFRTGEVVGRWAWIAL